MFSRPDLRILGYFDGVMTPNSGRKWEARKLLMIHVHIGIFLSRHPENIKFSAIPELDNDVPAFVRRFYSIIFTNIYPTNISISSNLGLRGDLLAATHRCLAVKQRGKYWTWFKSDTRTDQDSLESLLIHALLQQVG